MRLKHEKDQLIDNLGILRSVEDIVGKDIYSSIIGYWALNNYEAMEKALRNWVESNNSAFITSFIGEILLNEFINTLRTLKHEFQSFMNDDLYNIYVGLDHTGIEDATQSDCRLKPYFIFRCGNNGRTDLITFE